MWSEKLMAVLNNISQCYGPQTIRLAAMGVARSWNMLRVNLSPGYTTSWDGLPVVHAG